MAEIEADPLEAFLRKLMSELEWKPKEVFMPLRTALTARKATPPLFATMEVLGKERCRRRLRNTIALLKTL